MRVIVRQSHLFEPWRDINNVAGRLGCIQRLPQVDASALETPVAALHFDIVPHIRDIHLACLAQQLEGFMHLPIPRSDFQNE